jgi:hypothetical protein
MAGSLGGARQSPSYSFSNIGLRLYHLPKKEATSVDRTFSHRFNARDGTVDSICHRCFHTVAKASSEVELQVPEEKHTCNPEEQLRFKLIATAAKMTSMKKAS